MSNKSVTILLMPFLGLAHFDVHVVAARAWLQSERAAAASSGLLFPKVGSRQQPFLLVRIRFPGDSNRLRLLFKEVLPKLVYPHLSLKLTARCDALGSC